jgi:hypothetical protein
MQNLVEIGETARKCTKNKHNLLDPRAHVHCCSLLRRTICPLMESIPSNLHGFVSLFQFYTYINITVTFEVNGHGKLDMKVRYTEDVWYIGRKAKATMS